MRVWMVAVSILACGAAAAGPRCGSAEARWTTDLAIASKPAIDCASLTAIVDAFALLDQRDLPNAQARRGKTIDYPKAVLDLLKQQRDGAACRALHDAVAKTSDSSVALHAVELITLIDNPAGSCTKGLRRALGDNPDAKGLLEQAADLCSGRKEAHCAELLKQAQ